MQFTGSELIQKRSFYTQNLNFGFAFDCYVDQTTGRYDFGLSGTTGLLFNFTLLSGKMLLNNTFIHNYQPFERFYIEAQITSGKFNVLKNGAPLLYGNDQPSGDFSYFYVQRSLPSLLADWNLSVSGQNTPQITVDSIGYLLTTGQTGVTGNLHNNGSYPLRVFNSTVNGSQGLLFNPLVGNVTGYSYSGFSLNSASQFSSFNFSQPSLINMNTNFGDINVLFSIVDARSQNIFVHLQPIDDWSFNAQDELNRSVFYNNYSGGFQTTAFNTSLFISLTYLSGSGQFVEPNFAPVVNYFTTGYGNFLERGYLTGVASGTMIDDNGITGFYLINVSQFAWATGAVSGFFTGIGSGIGSGLGYTGLAVGTFTGLATGFVYNGSGSLVINGLQVGVGINGSSVNYQSYTTATGYINLSGLQQGDYFYVGVESVALTKGVQFNNTTGLVYYFSGNSQHQVSSFASGGLVYLTSLFAGTQGNGIFIRSGSCQDGYLIASPFLTGGTNNGVTGISLVPIGPYTGFISQTIIGSGDYATPISGVGTGIFIYTKTFTGNWDILTGVDANSLISLKSQGNYNPIVISGSGSNFPPNSSINIQINHVANPYSTDYAILIISGNNVLNPITQTLNN